MENKERENDKNIGKMRAELKLMLDEEADYRRRLEAYEFLSENCDAILDEMTERIYTSEGDTGKMLMEVLSNYKGSKAVYMGLVSWLYKGDDVALFAKLLGSYGNEAAIDVLKGYVNEFEVDYSEFIEIRNAVEALGGDFEFNEDFSEDPVYRYLKGLDEDEPDSRRSPFEDLFSGNPPLSDSGHVCRDEECSCHLHDEDHEVHGGCSCHLNHEDHGCCSHVNDEDHDGCSCHLNGENHGGGRDRSSR